MTAPTVITFPIGTPLEKIERDVTMATLEHCGFNKTLAAKMLGISLKTLYNRLEVYTGKRASERKDYVGVLPQ